MIPKPLLKRLVLQNVAWTAGLGALLLLSADTLDWPAAWLFLATTIIGGFASGLWFASRDPGLLEERMNPMMQEGQPAADKVFMLVFGACGLIWFVLMGLDRRWHGSDLHPALQAFGYLLLLTAFALILRVARENSFAAPVVKIQAERGQRVIDTGPYAIVRHPMYSGAVLYFVSVALLLGSRWGLLASPIFLVLFAVRSRLEEHTLLAGLSGYADYTTRVRYRLVPGLW